MTGPILDANILNYIKVLELLRPYEITNVFLSRSFSTNFLSYHVQSEANEVLHILLLTKLFQNIVLGLQ